MGIKWSRVCKGTVLSAVVDTSASKSIARLRAGTMISRAKRKEEEREYGKEAEYGEVIGLCVGMQSMAVQVY